MYGNCTAKKIELTFDDRNIDRNHVSMRNPVQFFYFDVINYTYEGVVSLMQGRIQGGGVVGALKLEKNMIFWHKIVIFHTKYPNNFRTSLRSAYFS
jgi:hypothetical protein